MVRIDGHIHLFRRPSIEHPRAVSPLFPVEREALAPEFLDMADTLGIHGAVVVALSHEDRYVEECVEQYPDRFAGIAVFDPPENRGPRDEEILDLLRFDGVRIHRLGEPGTDHVEDLPVFALLEAMSAAGRTLWYYSTEDQLPLFERVVERFPDLPVVMNHLGFSPREFANIDDGLPSADVELAPASGHSALRFADRPNVNIMVSGEYCFSREDYPYADVAPIVRAVYDAFGPERMLWASDHPWLTSGDDYARLAALPAIHLPDASQSDLEQIMGGTASRLFPNLR